MSSFRSEPFLWIHLAGLAVAPLFLEVVWIALGVSTPIPFFWLELVAIATVGILPIFWMQWQRPFDIFSFLVVAVKPEQLTREQQQILTLFNSKKQRFLALITAILMVLVLWQIYRLSPLAFYVAYLVPQWRLGAVAVAAVAFLLSNLFIQIPVSVLGVMLTTDNKFSSTEPIPIEQIPQKYSIFGFKVANILPLKPTENSVTTINTNTLSEEE